MPARSWLGSMVVSFVALPILALAGEPTAGSMAGAQAAVAAGFGFQDEESSFITVKTYDAQSGEVLSAETYELDIKDDGPPSNHPRTRIFAGGVGVGSGSLSEFTLRVYDASNGQFLWEGRLNLTSGDHPEAATHRVVAQIRPRAAVTRVASRSQETGQPYFVLRALHPETGRLVWSDEFSPGGLGARVERISRSVVGMTGTAPRDIDFRIKMPDQAGRRLLWEDKVEPADDGEASGADSQDENANILRGQPQPRNPSSRLHASWPSSGIETDRRTATVQLAWPTPSFAFS
jgi:hypothetical protein